MYINTYNFRIYFNTNITYNNVVNYVSLCHKCISNKWKLNLHFNIQYFSKERYITYAKSCNSIFYIKHELWHIYRLNLWINMLFIMKLVLN